MTGPVPPAGSHGAAAVVDGVDIDAVAAAAAAARPSMIFARVAGAAWCLICRAGRWRGCA
jgi:hypothetical protein